MEPRSAPPTENPFAAPEAESIEGPQVDTQEAYLADRGTRFAGAIIDTLLFVLAAAPGAVVMAVQGEESVSAWTLIAAPLLTLWIYQMYLTATTGQSLAKRWLKMKIVKVDGSPVNFVSGVILRSWVLAGLGMLPFVGSFVGLVDALMIFGDDRQCLHDKIASTRVIDVSAQAGHWE